MSGHVAKAMTADSGSLRIGCLKRGARGGCGRYGYRVGAGRSCKGGKIVKQGGDERQRQRECQRPAPKAPTCGLPHDRLRGEDGQLASQTLARGRNIPPLATFSRQSAAAGVEVLSQTSAVSSGSRSRRSTVAVRPGQLRFLRCSSPARNPTPGPQLLGCARNRVSSRNRGLSGRANPTYEPVRSQEPWTQGHWSGTGAARSFAWVPRRPERGRRCSCCRR